MCGIYELPQLGRIYKKKANKMKSKRKKSWLLGTALIVCGLVFVGCATFGSGNGVGTGVGTYKSVWGELRRTYEAGYDQTLEASTTTLTRLKIKLTQKISDGINTTLIAQRANGTPVTIKIAMMAPELTQVGVRCGRIGIWGQKVSRLIHDHIAKSLQ